MFRFSFPAFRSRPGRLSRPVPRVLRCCHYRQFGRVWRQLARESDEEIGLCRTGVIYRADAGAQMRAYQDFMAVVAARDLDTRSEAQPEMHAGAVSEKGGAFRRRQDGGHIYAGGGWRQPSLALGPDSFRHAATDLPALRAHPFATRHACRAPASYPDGWGKGSAELMGHTVST